MWVNEERFQLFSNASIDGMAIHSQGKIVDVNATLAAMTGYAPEELIGRPLTDLTVPGERQALMAHVGSGSEQPIEGTALRKDGSSFPVEVRARNVTTGGVVARMVVIRDISERRAAERAVRESEARLRLLLQQLPAILWTTDRDLRITSMLGRAVASDARAGEGSVIGEFVRDYLAGRDNGASVVDAHHAALLGSSDTCAVESGGVRWSAHVEPLISANGKISGVIGLAMDVTEPHRLAELLSESETRYRSLVESMPDAVAVHVDGRFVFINNAGLRLVAATAAEQVVGREVLDFVHPESLELARSQINSLLGRRDSILTGRYRLMRRDGTSVETELSAAALDYGGRPAVQMVCRDISDRLKTEAALRQAELQLQHSQKLEAVGRLAGGIAHDFNNLLTVISAFTQMAKVDLLPDDPRGADLQEVENAARRAAELTRQLLAFSRTQVLQSANVDMHDVVRSMENMLQRVIGEEVRLETRVAGDDAWVYADRGQLEQVLMNLVVNARDAMPHGGAIMITSRVVSLDDNVARSLLAPGALGGQYARLDVRDNGVGIEQALQPHVFEPFFTTKPVGKGTGLGLAMVYGIVKQSNGYIVLDSAPARGTTVSVYLPAVTTRTTPRDNHMETPSASGSETILLVEDQGAVREAARRILESHGYRVIAAGHALEALDLSRVHHGEIDLLLTDLVMADIGGRELAMRLAAEQPNIPVLYMSGYATGQGIALQLDGQRLAPLLDKPFTIESLTQAVRGALRRRTTNQ